MPIWYNKAMMAEKKIMVGRALKAKFIRPTWKPTSGINDLNKKSPPASEKLINLLMILSKKPNSGFPNLVLRMKIANNHCNPKPKATNRRLIFVLLFDITYAIKSNTIIPIKPVNLSIIIYFSSLKHFRQRASYLFVSPSTTCFFSELIR